MINTFVNQKDRKKMVRNTAILWTKINCPVSMKQLTAMVRDKALLIANAMSKGDKKMKEEVILATAINHAKNKP